jgi:hypothetical protein
MTAVQIAECRLRLARRIRRHEAPQLRGFFGRRFEDQVLLHNHRPGGEPIYQYPRVQFKVLESMAVLVGINEGSQLLQQLWLEIDETRLGGEHLEVLQAEFESRHEEIHVTAEPIEYRFVTPWLALNQKNFRSYVGSRNPSYRKDELARILVGNCLGLAKSLGIRFHERIHADCRGLTSIKTTLKGNGMIGFVGKFSINVAIPEYIGLGKSVSRGFGTIAAG